MKSTAMNVPAQRKADFIEPMECALVSKLPDGQDSTFEVRIAEALHDLPADTVIDGEVVTLDQSGLPDLAP